MGFLQVPNPLLIRDAKVFYIISGLFLLSLVTVVPFTLSVYLLVWLPSQVNDIEEVPGPGPGTIREAIPYSEAMKIMELDKLLEKIQNKSIQKESQLKEMIDAPDGTNGKNLGIDSYF